MRRAKADSLFGGNNTVLAPMAGFTDVAFRSICHEYGCGLTVTEMVSSKALVMNNSATRALLARLANDSPCAVQIFGHQPQVMADSVQLPELSGFDAIDVNMGCPVHKIVSNGEGSALLENVKLASDIIRALRLATDKPLSVKFRLGVSDSKGAVDFAKMCCDSGADFITVHLRTRKQMYSGNADYSILPDIVKAVDIPVIANGDVIGRQQYLHLVNDCGAYGVAVGRGALGRPYIFAQLLDKPYQFDIAGTVRRHANTLLQYKPQRVVVNEMKKHIAYYLKGLRNAKSVVVAVQNASCVDEQIKLVQNFCAKEDIIND